MSFQTQRTADNTVTHSALSVRYAVTSKTKDNKWEAHRYIHKSFSVVGLDEGSAKTVANAIAASLKRTFFLWQEGDDGELEKVVVQLMMDEVEAVHDNGPFWRVDVNIDEDDTTYVDNVSSDLSLAEWPVAPVLNNEA